ncbi:MAG: saccharopine dehydrogenase NADP-binding domain-containing protein [Phycisphaerales bacterium]|nr:saccharopine dehydrogenase NADP-binding domain-containing protein [Phycisphaerales bacterium]
MAAAKKSTRKSSAGTNVVVLGGGLIGSVIASDLASSRGMKVTVADSSATALKNCIRRAGTKLGTVEADLSDADDIARVVADADLVVGALPSGLGLNALETVIDVGRHYVDISFMSESNLHLSELARKKRVTAVVDMGVAPGMSNMLCGYGAQKLDRCDRLEILVGGLPRHRHWPWEYKASWSPSDVLEEYVRPVRVVEGGKIVWKEALTEPELADFEGVGTLETFLTDGLRSLADTLDVPDMVEKTMRYPGHIELMRVLRHLGLFSPEPVTLPDGTSVRPLDLTSQLLFPQWKFEKGEPDCTVMRITAEGQLGKVATRLTWDVVDDLDPETGFSSMSRCTAFPAAAMARMIADGSFKRRGVFAPEQIANDKGLLDRMLKELKARGVEYVARVETID